MKLLLNYGNIENEINEQLQKLKRFALYKNKKDDIIQLSEIVAKTHTYDLNQSGLPVYNFQWVINLIKENYKYKNDVISALELVSEMEQYNTDIKIKNNNFISWDISRSNWHKEYKAGHIGSYVWDIAAILHYVNDPEFSDVFLESYIDYSGKKPTLIALYSNLYYVNVVESVINDNFKDVMIMTNTLLNQNTFKTNIISNKTLSRLQIVGY